MKKINLILLIAIIVFVAVVAILISRGDEGAWLCQNGQWVKQGNPTSPMPTTSCEGANSNEAINTNTGLANPASVYCRANSGTQKIQENESGQYGICEFADGSACEEWAYFRNECQPGKNISVFYPGQNNEVSLPFIVAGAARVFENVVSFRLKDASGEILFAANAMANSPDMGQFGGFAKEINYLTKAPKSSDVILEVFQASAKDGSDADKISVPLKLNLGETVKLKIFMNNGNLDPAATCNKVFPLERIVTKTDTPARTALELLLAGEILPKEAAAGYTTSINSGVKIQKLTIENGVAKVDFDKTLEEAVGGSCRVAAIRVQIVETLKQFVAVENVVISIDGRTEDILQP